MGSIHTMHRAREGHQSRLDLQYSPPTEVACLPVWKESGDLLGRRRCSLQHSFDPCDYAGSSVVLLHAGLGTIEEHAEEVTWTCRCAIQGSWIAAL